MNRITTAIVAGLAISGLSTSAFAQATDNGASFSLSPSLTRGGPTPPALNAPGEPSGVNAPVTVAEGGRMSLPPGQPASPVGPGSGATFALDVPADVEVSLATLDINRAQPGGSGGFSTASGPDSDRDSVTPVLGLDLTTPDPATMGFKPVQTPTQLGQ